MDVFWFLPTHGDGHYLGTTQGARPVTLNYLKQVAQAADSLGYHGVLIPTGRIDYAYPGGPITGRFSARFGPDNKLISSFTMTGPSAAARLSPSGT